MVKRADPFRIPAVEGLVAAPLAPTLKPAVVVALPMFAVVLAHR